MDTSPFTSRTTRLLDQIAAEHGWHKATSDMGDDVEYRRKTLYIHVGLSVTGAVTYASTNRRGGRIATGRNKSEFVVQMLEGC